MIVFADTFRMPKHIKAIVTQAEEYEKKKKVIAKASEISMVDSEEKELKDNLYYDPESNEEQWDKNRSMVRQAVIKRREHPTILPLKDSPGTRPVPAGLLEVFETSAHEDPNAWDKRRKMSAELQEELTKAEAMKHKAVHEGKHHSLFAPAKEKKHEDKKKLKVLLT